jgi:hypothetical protein
MANGRCRLHEGKSTGPRTAEGLERMRRAKTKHGLYSAETLQLIDASGSRFAAGIAASGRRPVG